MICFTTEQPVLPSEWDVDDHDHGPDDPSQAEIRERINQLWRFKQEAVSMPSKELAVRAVADALPGNGSEIRRADLVRACQDAAPLLKPASIDKALIRMTRAGIVKTRRDTERTSDPRRAGASVLQCRLAPGVVVTEEVIDRAVAIMLPSNKKRGRKPK